jgi:peptidyl-prolyl cis-trans isomerase D
MITFMRRYRRSLQVGLLLVIAAFVASLFVFGVGSDGRDAGPRDSVASVNSEPIPMERYQRRYGEYVQAYSQMLRERFSQEMLERMGLQQQVVEDLVQEALVVQRAEAEGLTATDEELNAQIQTIPAFHEGGRFTVKRYEEVLRRLGYTTASFEDEIRRRLTRIKVENAVRGGVKVSDTEVEQAFVHTREEVRAAWALVELAPLEAAQTVTDEELTTYLKDHAAEFREPDRRRIQYVAVNPKDTAPTVTDAQVEKYYSEHASEFETPRQVQASHILVRVPETGGSQAEDQAKARVVDAIRRSKSEDFAKLARELSQDPASALKGGELGWVSKGEMVPAFEQALFALRKGEVSAEPVRTPFGFHAIRVLDIREGGKKPLKDVAGQIRARLVTEGADQAAKSRAEAVRGQLAAGSDFMAEARKLGLTPVETTIARRDSSMAGLLPPEPMEQTAFELAVGGVSSPVKTPAGWVVLKSVQSLPAAVPPLAEIKAKVAAARKREKADGVALERAKQLAADAKQGEFSAAAKKHEARASETSRFSRAKPAERLPGDAQMAALRVQAGQVSEPVKTPQGYYVLKVLERVPPDLGALASERDKISTELLGRKQGQAWQAWLADARRNAKIETTTRPIARPR